MERVDKFTNRILNDLKFKSPDSGCKSFFKNKRNCPKRLLYCVIASDSEAILSNGGGLLRRTSSQ